MDFSSRGSQQSPAAPRPSNAFPAENSKPGRASRGGFNNKWLKWGAGALLVAVAVLILAVLAITILPSNGKSESSYVDSSKLQAVFLTNNQVYFGKIDQLNNKTLVLSDIYYLRTDSNSTDQNAQANNSNVSLVKLGCELHKPYDKMIINRDQVQFWENLQSDGQVASAVKQYQQSNPTNKCTNTTSGAASTNSVQGGATSSTPATTPNTKQ